MMEVLMDGVDRMRGEVERASVVANVVRIMTLNFQRPPTVM